MDYNKLFEVVSSLVGDISTFEGLLFDFEHGTLVVDYYDTGYKGEIMFVCDFTPLFEGEPIRFAAKGIDELKLQLSELVLE